MEKKKKHQHIYVLVTLTPAEYARFSYDAPLTPQGTVSSVIRSRAGLAQAPRGHTRPDIEIFSERQWLDRKIKEKEEENNDTSSDH